MAIFVTPSRLPQSCLVGETGMFYLYFKQLLDYYGASDPPIEPGGYMGIMRDDRKPGLKKTLFLCVAGFVLGLAVNYSMAQDSESISAVSAQSPFQSPSSLWNQWTLDSVKFTGTMTFQYQGRFHGEDEDNEFYRSLYLEMEGLDGGKISGALGVRFLTNLDHFSQYRNNTTYYVYEGISDSYSHRNFSRLYYGYLDFSHWIGPGRLRIGRQSLFPVDYLQFDGASYLLEDWKNQLDVELFAGIPVEYYSSRDGDYTYGATMNWKAMDWLSFKGAGMVYSDSSHHNELFGLGSRQQLGERLQVIEDWTFLESRGRDLQFQGIYSHSERGFTLNATYYRQLRKLGEFADPYSPYYQALSDYEPFHLFNLSLSQEMGDRWVLEGGGTWRDLIDSKTESDYNHAYQMYWGGVTLRDFMVQNLSLSLFLQRWDTDAYTTYTTAIQNSNPDDPANTQSDEVLYYFTVPGDRNDTLSAELQFRWGEKRKNRIQLGTDYQKYKYHYETDEEFDNVRTWYIKCRYWLNDKWQLYNRFQLEKQSGDPDNYFRVVSALSHRF